jgi:hypothetical protein
MSSQEQREAGLLSAPTSADLPSAPIGATHASRCQEAEFTKRRPRPCTPGYKNRNLVQSKLTDELYRKAWIYCCDHGYSFSSFTRSLYESFFSES